MREFLSELIKKDIHIDHVGGELSIKFPKMGVDTAIFEDIKVRKNAIIEYLKNLKKNEFIFIPKIARSNYYSISDAQRRLWVLSQFEGSSVTYSIPGSITLNEHIDITCFMRAIDSTIERHEILRTVFREDETGEVRQWVLDTEEIGFKVDYKDLRKEKDKDERVNNYIAEDSKKSFDLTKGPLLRSCLLQVGDESYVFYYNMHHIISDGWSMEVLRKDVFSYYEAYKSNTEPQLKPLRIQYKDYSAWQLSQLEEESFRSHREYWLKSLEGELALLDLPSTKSRPRIKTNNGHGLSTYIDSKTTGKLKKYSQGHGGSLFMGLLAAWNVLMYRYTSQTDIIIGSPIAGREHTDLEDQIGFYVNTLALRNEINPEESFNDFYNKLKDKTLKSYDHQVYPFDRLVEDLGLRRDTSRSAIFDVLLVLQNNGENKEHDLRAIGLEEENVGSSRVDLQACKLEYSIVSPK